MKVLLKIIFSQIYNRTTGVSKVLILNINLLERRYTSIKFIATYYMFVDRNEIIHKQMAIINLIKFSNAQGWWEYVSCLKQ